jgi:hypothetical protein
MITKNSQGIIVGDLVAFNDRDDASWYKVTRIDGRDNDLLCLQPVRGGIQHSSRTGYLIKQHKRLNQNGYYENITYPW